MKEAVIQHVKDRLNSEKLEKMSENVEYIPPPSNLEGGLNDFFT